MQQVSEKLRKYLLIALGVVCLLVGVMTVWTPLPTGIPLLALGIVVLATVSATARRLVKRARRHNGLFDRSMVAIESRAGRALAAKLRRTRPLERKLKARHALAAADRALSKVREKADRRRTAGGH